MRCDCFCRTFWDNFVVSIHTPTWGVTETVSAFYFYVSVSIHTPTWGVTISIMWTLVCILFQSTHLHEVWLLGRIELVRFLCFNPHTYMRCDRSKRSKSSSRMVSIHTPTWGVTVPLLLYLDIFKFQSTHLHEVWHQCLSEVWHSTLFQSTHLHEVWHRRYDTVHWIWRFNPHTYMRCDQEKQKKCSKQSKFQSTHLHEVWQYISRTKVAHVSVSIHTPTWGVTYNYENN